MNEINITIDGVEVIVNTSKGAEIKLKVPVKGAVRNVYEVVKEVYGIESEDISLINFTGVKTITVGVPAWKFISENVYASNHI